MKVVEQSSALLRLQNRTLRSIWGRGATHIALGLLVGLGFGRITYLACDRTEPDQAKCSLTEIGFFPQYNEFVMRPAMESDQWSALLHSRAVRMAWVPQTSKQPNWANSTPNSWYTVIRLTKPHLETFGAGSSPSLRTLTANEDLAPFFQLSGVVLLILGASSWLFGRTSIFTLDKRASQLVYGSQRILRPSSFQTVSLKSLQVFVERYEHLDGDITSTLFVQLPTGERIELISDLGKTAERFAPVVADFLEVEVQHIEESAKNR
jgi:hypothetical protein